METSESTGASARSRCHHCSTGTRPKAMAAAALSISNTGLTNRRAPDAIARRYPCSVRIESTASSAMRAARNFRWRSPASAAGLQNRGAFGRNRADRLPARPTTQSRSAEVTSRTADLGAVMARRGARPRPVPGTARGLRVCRPPRCARTGRGRPSPRSASRTARPPRRTAGRRRTAAPRRGRR